MKATDTVYFWAKSYLTPTGSGYQQGAYRFHAIDAVSLKERPGFPVNFQGTPGKMNVICFALTCADFFGS